MPCSRPARTALRGVRELLEDEIETLEALRTSAHLDGSHKTGLKKVWRLLQRASDAGDLRAAYAVATWYLHGKGDVVAPSLSRAIPLLRKSSVDVPDAAFDLAICYEKGAGVPKNANKAVALYLRAALRGQPQSHYEMGRCYWHGLGVNRDRKIARVWFDRAEELGISE